MILCLIVDHIRATKDIWIVGDHLVRTAYPYLQKLDGEHKRGYPNYIQDHYDHYGYFPSFTESNTLKMLRDTLVEGLNRRIRLPNCIIILCSEKLITGDPLYLPSELERKIKWVIKEYIHLINIRKSLLPAKAYVMGEPRIMWVQAFNNTRRNNISTDQIVKFNNLLRRVCATKAIYTIPIDDVNSSRCFDRDGKTQIEDGFRYLWHEIINGVKHHDEKDKQNEINHLVEERLNEMNLKDSVRQENRQHTYSIMRRNELTAERSGNCDMSASFKSENGRNNRINYQEHDSRGHKNRNRYDFNNSYRDSQRSRHHQLSNSRHRNDRHRTNTR